MTTFHRRPSGLWVPEARGFRPGGGLRGGQSALRSAGPSVVVAVGAPTVTAISPTQGVAGGGTFVTITGTNFVSTGLEVKANNDAGAAFTSAVVINATTIEAYTPAGSGTIGIYVETVNGNGTLAAAYTYGSAVCNEELALYLNTCEATDANTQLADDFHSGAWYVTNADQGGGSLANKGWYGTIYANPITPAGAVVANSQFGDSAYAATTGVRTGAPSANSKNMAEHSLKNGSATELYLRIYLKLLSAGYVNGHEKMFDFLRGAGGTGQIMSLSYDYFGSGAIRHIPYLHQDDGRQGQPNAWMGSNIASEIVMAKDVWYFYEMYIKLNTPGAYNGIFRHWMDSCGADGQSPPGSPTLRGEFTDVLFRNGGAEAGYTINGVWLESWANAGTNGERIMKNLMVSTVGPIGLMT